tara:strand:+ start:499 stop:1530 length:1032 start_codon:yes stop_codon:yes gene_type:complete
LTSWTEEKTLTAWLLGLTLVVVAIGGLIRIYDAGESCPDWPTCFGTWGFDVSHEDQEAWYSANPDEIDSRGSGHRYTTFQIFTEWSHRILAGAVLGPLVLVNWYSVRKNQELSKEARIASSVTVGLILWQGAVGWLTVELDNLHWSVALHMGSALAFTMSMVWLWLAISRSQGGVPSWIDFESGVSRKWGIWVSWLTIGAFLSIFSGTFVSTTPGANTGCGVDGLPNSWPLCGGNLVDSIDDLVAQSQMIHRWFVGTVWVALVAASYWFWKDSGEVGALRSWVWLATGLYTVNAGIGATYILSWDLEGGFLEFLSLVHLMLASLTFLALATAWIGCAISTEGD